MCVSPSRLPSGILVGCRRCWQCLSNRVSDWVGRNIAETKTATRSYSVRLSYGRSKDGRADHLRSVFLVYSDIQKFLKRLRKRGYKVRYMIAGEYGSTYGRAHWHCIFHFYGDVFPEWDGAHLTWSERQWNQVGGIHIPEWADYEPDGTLIGPLGHVHIKRAQYAHMTYALKYMLKDQFDPMQQNKFTMSKYPPLGYTYFTELAKDTARAHLSPRSLKYRFPVVKYDGTETVKEFMLRGKMAEVYIQTFINEWKLLYGNTRWPESEDVDAYHRFGRLGRSENLTPVEVESKQLDARLQVKVDEMERPKTLQEYLRAKDKSDKIDFRGELNDWERTYFDKTWEQFERPRSDFNRSETVAGLCGYFGYSEQQFWGLPPEQLLQQWDEYNAVIAP